MMDVELVDQKVFERVKTMAELLVNAVVALWVC